MKRRKRFLTMFLCITLVFTMLPEFGLNTEQQVYAAGQEEPKAWIEGYADGSTTNFRASQMLTVKTSGFSPKAKLKYHYYATTDKRCCNVFSYHFLFAWPVVKLKQKKSSTSGPFGLIGAIANVVKAGQDLLSIEDGESDSPYFAISDSDATSMKVRIVVTDTNKFSDTYNKSVEIMAGPYLKSDLNKDICVPYAMFEGEEKPLLELITDSGVAHIYPECDTCATINTLEITNVDAGTVTQTPHEILGLTMVKAEKAGLAKLKIALSKAGSCAFHPGQTGAGESYIKVFKKVTATPVDDGFDLTNTEKGVTYTIGSKSVTCQNDGEQLSVRGLDSVK